MLAKTTNVKFKKNESAGLSRISFFLNFTAMVFLRPTVCSAVGLGERRASLALNITGKKKKLGALNAWDATKFLPQPLFFLPRVLGVKKITPATKI